MIANQLSEILKLSEEQIALLEEEIIAYEINPDEGSSWEDIKEKILNRK
jgi:hypothetical protein